MLLEDKNLYYVGGVVRDEILSIPSIDTDFCYEGNAITFAKEKDLNIIKTNEAFGTVRVLIEKKHIDIASTRTETYPKKGHLPKVENIGCSLKEDLIRRDFTINAMAKRTTDGKFIDYFGGQEDIQNKKLKLLHEKSFVDDPTRIIRGLKFSVRFGFELEEKTRELQDEYLNNINYDMSYHRIRKELIETFNLNNSKAYDRFIEQGIYKLLGKNVKKTEIKGYDIRQIIGDISTPYLWLFYIATFIPYCFDIETIYPTRAERRIIEWAKKLKYQKAGNNTPIESYTVRRILDNA